MRKVLSLIAVLWVATALFANNDPTKPFYKTYSVQTAPYTTKYMTFEPYHANLQLDKLVRVSEGGDFHVDLTYLTGMRASKEQLSGDDAGKYYAIPLTIPSYQVKVYNKTKELVMDKIYGGTDATVDFGKEKNYEEAELANTWATEQKSFLQQAEFQHLSFQQLQEDLLLLVKKLESTANTLTSTTKEAPSTKNVSAQNDIFSDTDTDIFADATEAITEKVAMVDNELTEKNAPVKVIKNPRSNIVKLHLPNLAFKTITLNYERILTDRSSASLHIGYRIPSALDSTVTDILDIRPTKANEFSGFTVTGEYRMYSKKKGAAKGFYYAPYLRYANYKYLFDGTIDKNFSNIETKVSTIGLGAQLGYQWIIKDRFVIDWGILGLAAQRYTVSGTFSSKDDMVSFKEIQAELEKETKDNSIIGGKASFTSGDGFLEAKLPFLFGGLRSYFSIGMQF